MKHIIEWNQDKMLAELSGKVVAGMDVACGFVAERARSRMKRRSGIMASNVAHVVKARGEDVTGYVGVRRGKAFYAYFREKGTSKAAAHPTLWPAVIENAQQIVRMIATGK